MKTSATTRRYVLFVLLAGIFVWLLCIVFNPFEPPEPQYQGKKLSDWAGAVDQGIFFGHLMFPTNREQSELAITAIRHIGTNALPVALKLCGAKDSWPKRKLEEWIDQHNYDVENDNLGLPKDQWRSEIPVNFTSAGEKHYKGANIIWALGPMAKPIIPDLIRLLENQDQLYDDTMRALLSAGTNAIPPLVKLLDNANPEVRLRAAFVLADFFRPMIPLTPGSPLIVVGSEHFRPEARAAVPLLLQCLENQKLDQVTRIRAIYSLGLIHEDASVVVPAMIRHMQTQTNNWILSSDYIRVLGNFGTNAKPAVPMLIQILESEPEGPNKDYSPLKIDAMAALSKIGPEAAKPAVPALLHILESKPEWPQDDYSPLKNTALFTLSKIDPEAAKPFVPRLLHILESESDWPGGYSPGQMFALVALWRVDPETAWPFFEKWQPSQAWVMGELEKLDPEAAEPFLEKWNASQNRRPP
jgi:HEAT repeat protein